MVVKFLDPFNDDKYGKLRGDKSDSYFKVTFSEAKVHKTDDAYIIAGQVTAYEGITRSFKPELPLEPGLCAVPIYGKEYEIRRKDGEKYVSDKFNPSIFELYVYKWIEAHQDIWIGDDRFISGSIIHPPNGMLASLDGSSITDMLATNMTFKDVTPTGILLPYEPPKTYGGSRGGGKSYGLPPSEKFTFIKKQLATDIQSGLYSDDMSLLALIGQLLVENPLEQDVTQLYFDCLLACVK